MGMGGGLGTRSFGLEMYGMVNAEKYKALEQAAHAGGELSRGERIDYKKNRKRRALETQRSQFEVSFVVRQSGKKAGNETAYHNLFACL